MYRRNSGPLKNERLNLVNQNYKKVKDQCQFQTNQTKSFDVTFQSNAGKAFHQFYRNQIV